MSQHYKNRRLTNKEKLDVSTMAYFIPKTITYRIYPNDKKKMADLSSRGVWPKGKKGNVMLMKTEGSNTLGFKLLQTGKTYRDMQITAYKEDISNGYFTKIELLDAMPERLRGWLWSKIEDVPYDVDGDTSKFMVTLYEQEFHNV